MEKKDILFPFDDYRKIQKEMIEEVVDVLEKREHLIMHAPTGLGKTSVLAPAIAYAKKHDKKVFFLTPRHTQHKIVVELVKKIREKFDENIITVDFLGKMHMCSMVSDAKQVTSGTFYDYCKYLRREDMCEYYTNIFSKRKKEGRLSLLNRLKEANPQHAETFKQTCTEFKYCPYEMAARLGEKATVIIGDYYHLFSHSIRDSLFTRLGISLSDCIVIVDEAHNLPDRTKKLLTASITTRRIEQAIRQSEKYGLELEDELGRIRNQLVTVSKRLGFGKTEDKVGKDIFKVSDADLEQLSSISEDIFEKEEQNHIISIVNFVSGWIENDEQGYIRMAEIEQTRQGGTNIRLSKKCIDASKAVAPVSLEVSNMILMSGTLSPVNVYRDILGVEGRAIEFGNPFPVENELNLIVPRTSTQYQKRSEAMYAAIGTQCALIADSVPGNLAIFFPSYALLEEVKKHFETKCKKSVFTEVSNMSKEEKGMFIENFKKYKNRGAVLLGVSAGSFGEGIDLMGDFLKAVVVVGMPFTKPDLETDETIKFLDFKYGNGWDYAYLFPMLIKTFQNAGRCIRSETDKGVVIYLDERYNWPRYKKYFPQTKEMKASLNPEVEIVNFFTNGQNTEQN